MLNNCCKMIINWYTASVIWFHEILHISIWSNIGCTRDELSSQTYISSTGCLNILLLLRGKLFRYLLYAMHLNIIYISMTSNHHNIYIVVAQTSRAHFFASETALIMAKRGIFFCPQLQCLFAPCCFVSLSANTPIAITSISYSVIRSKSRACQQEWFACPLEQYR